MDENKKRSTEVIPDEAVNAARSSSGENFLVTIAINDYQDAKIPSLDNCVRDARKLTEVLTQRYGFKSKGRLENEEATELNIENLFDRLAREVTPDDNLVILFSGHGIYYKDRDEGAWLPYDTQVEALAGGVRRFRNSLLNPVVVSALRPIKSRHTVLISDSCFSGSLLSRHRDALDTVYNKPTRVVLTSGLQSQTVQDSVKGSEHSPFAHYLVEKLEGNTEKHLGMIELWGSVRQRMRVGNLEQVPNFGALDIKDNDFEGEFFFFLNGEVDPTVGTQASTGGTTRGDSQSTGRTSGTNEPANPPSNTINDAFRKEVRDLISQGKTEKALELAVQRMGNEASVLSAKYKSSKREYNMGLIDFQDWQRIQNSVNYGLLELLSGE